MNDPKNGDGPRVRAAPTANKQIAGEPTRASGGHGVYVSATAATISDVLLDRVRHERLLEQHGFRYGVLRLAMVFTLGLVVEGMAYKTVRDSWDKKHHALADGPHGAAILKNLGLTHNPAVVLRASRLLGVDIDGDDGRALVQELVPGGLPDTVAVRSGRADGGLHLWYRPPEGATKFKIQFAGKLALSKNGYLIVPPAWHSEAGRRYEFVEGHSPWERKIAPFPQQLLDRLLAAKGHIDAESRADDSGPIGEGDRHAHLLRIAGAMRYHGCGEETIVAALLVENERRCNPPKPEHDVRELAADVVRRYEPGERA
jgi:hypothetical protein